MIRRTLRPSGATAVLAFAILAAVAGCGGDDDRPAAPAAAAAAPAALRAGEPVPKPKGDAVLELSGRIGATNDGDRLALDIATLEQLGASEIELYEPFEKRRMEFRAIPMRNLLDVAGVAAGAKVLHSVALNDYVADIPAEVARGEGTYIATAYADGSEIPVEEGGPIRIVFLDGAEGADVHNYWTWSLATLEVR